MTIIDLSAERAKRDRPAPEFICTDSEGREMYAFSCSYRHGDGTYGLTFFAYDFEDAHARIEAIKSGLVLDGQIYEEIE